MTNFLNFYMKYVEDLKKAGTQYLGWCPFHRDKGSRRKGFSVNPDNGLWFCFSGCGGGSANFYVDFFGGGESSPSRIRVREALNTGVNILAVACPTCAMMLDEALNNEDIKQQQLIIKDISEVLLECI